MTDAVAIAYVHSTAVTYSWHSSYLGLIFWDLSHEGRIFRQGGRIEVHAGTGGLAAARNQAVQQFLAAPDSIGWMFWVDTDMGFEEDTVDRLLAAADPVERPIMGALAFAQKLPAADGMGGYQTLAVPTIYDWVTEEKIFRSRLEYEAEAVTRCAGTGMACILIHRSVFRRMYDQYGPHWYDLVPNEAGDSIGEDLSFCLRAATLEIPIHVHAGVKTTHYKGVWLDEAHYRTLRANAVEAGLGVSRA